MRRIQEVISAWLQYDTRASWSKLAEAVEGIDHRDIAERIRRKYITGHHDIDQSRAFSGVATDTRTDDAPDLLQLLEFPGKTKSFSIASEVGIKYKQFGIFLLNDGRGAKVDVIARKHSNDSEQINIEILQRWLAGEGRRVSWRTLVEVLNIIGLRQLATDITNVKKV